MNKVMTDEEREAAEVKRYCSGRVKKAARVLKMFYDGEDLSTAVGDCLADLMHLCEAKGYDFLREYEKGRTHFNAELIGGQHD